MTHYKKLYRSRDKRMLAGVAGGMGEYFNLDPTLIRLTFVVLAFLNLAGVIVYIVAAIIIPPEPPHHATREQNF